MGTLLLSESLRPISRPISSPDSMRNQRASLVSAADSYFRAATFPQLGNNEPRKPGKTNCPRIKHTSHARCETCVHLAVVVVTFVRSFVPRFVARPGLHNFARCVTGIKIGLGNPIPASSIRVRPREILVEILALAFPLINAWLLRAFQGFG